MITKAERENDVWQKKGKKRKKRYDSSSSDSDSE